MTLNTRVIDFRRAQATDAANQAGSGGSSLATASELDATREQRTLSDDLNAKSGLPAANHSPNDDSQLRYCHLKPGLALTLVFLSCTPRLAQVPPKERLASTAPATSTKAASEHEGSSTPPEVNPHPPATALPVESAKASVPLPPSNRVRSQEDCPEDMIFVPGGELSYPWLKDQKLGEGTFADVIHQGRVEAFCIDKREVRSLELSRSESTCPRDAGYCVGQGGAMPASCMTRERAICYCGQDKRAGGMRLPSAEEWLFAAVGETGNRTPWGNTWFPWGEGRFEGRPKSGRNGEKFCDGRPDPRKSGSPMAARWLPTNFQEFDSSYCTSHDLSMDRSPFGVENLGSNVLELTSLVVKHVNGKVVAPAFGVKHSSIDGLYDRPNLTLVNMSSVSVDTSLTIINRVRKNIGFRCVLSERVTDEETP